MVAQLLEICDEGQCHDRQPFGFFAAILENCVFALADDEFLVELLLGLSQLATDDKFIFDLNTN